MSAPKGHRSFCKKGEGGKPKVHTDAFIEKEADALCEWFRDPNNLYFKSFALERGYCAQRLSEFAEKNEKFAEAYRRAKDWQECRLVQGGLCNIYNPTITKFILINCHGWKERQEVSGSNVDPFIAQILLQCDSKTKDLVNKSGDYFV
jgi:DNA-packaging protein gp3